MATILPRSAWTSARNGRAGRPLSASQVDSITLHYPATPSNIGKASQARVAQLLRGWRAFHVGPQRRWSEIGYNYSVDQAGRIWNLSGNNRGAHAGGSGVGNRRSVGVLLVIGNNEQPSAALINGVKALRAHLLRTFPRATAVRPHSFWNNTSCPGNRVRSLINSGAFTGGAAPAQPSAPSGGFLMALSDRQQKELYEAVMDWRAGKSGSHHDGRVFSMFRDLHKTSVLLRQIAPGKSGVGHHGEYWASHIAPALAREPGKTEVNVDASALADRIVAQLGEGLASEVADELGRRIGA